MLLNEERITLFLDGVEEMGKVLRSFLTRSSVIIPCRWWAISVKVFPSSPELLFFNYIDFPFDTEEERGE